MAEPARKFEPDEVLPLDALVGPGTYQNVDNGRIIHKDHYGPLPPSGESIRYIKLSDDPTYGMSETDAQAYRMKVEGRETDTSHEHPTESDLLKTGEVMAAGTIKCMRCGNELTFEDNGRVPPCSVCTHTTWRRT